MLRPIKLFLIVGLFSLSVSIATVQADEGIEKKAVSAARDWLALIDRGKYGESWETAALFFKNAVTQEQWKQSLEGVRKPLGKVIQRKVKSKQHAKSLPGAPDGDYVIVQFETSFENKRAAIETVTPMLDKDGVWKVSGYYIK